MKIFVSTLIDVVVTNFHEFVTPYRVFLISDMFIMKIMMVRI